MASGAGRRLELFVDPGRFCQLKLASKCFGCMEVVDLEWYKG